ncbi:MAG TPA: CocE/NonD family hydrolase [Dehalococcoidales bacterium]|nr:CocE/NonD family hydrolase [Dehalococcoidales bacterium]
MLSTESIKVEINVPAKMRDGTILYADVYRPDQPAKFPAILTRLPYNKNISFPAGSGYMNPIRYARAGYAVVVQDVRGTGASEGQANFWHQESEDGYDSVEWLAAQPWCDGQVGMFGFSYFGHTQLTAAVTRPAHLKAICPSQTYSVAHSFPFSLRGDKFRFQIHPIWSLMISNLALLRSQADPARTRTLANTLMKLVDNIKEQYSFLPLKDAPAAKLIDSMGMMPSYADILLHKDDEAWWQELAGPLPLEKINVPAYHIAGWYDVDTLPGVIQTYQRIIENSESEVARSNQKLIIGPWIHTAEMLSKVGELEFGMSASGAVVDMAGLHIRWFDRWLKELDNGISAEPPVRIFVMGENRWRFENEWPLARTRYTPYYFHSRGRANSQFGDGLLNTLPPDEEPFDSYLYDPRHPVPSQEMGMGAFNQQAVEERPYVLVYTSAVLQTDLEVTGPVVISLFAATSAVDTDFSAKLVDVWPDGKAYNVAEGIIRAGYRESGRELKPVEPGQINQYNLSLGATSNVFKSGHRIRVEISSSDFPKWDRNLNTGHPIGQDAQIQLALQSIFHQPGYPSHILLPVIPR